MEEMEKKEKEEKEKKEKKEEKTNSSWFYSDKQFMILYRQTVHDFIQTNSSWFYTDKEFMILYRQRVHDFIQTNSSWFYTYKQFMILYWHYSWKPEQTDSVTDNTLVDIHLNRQTPKQTALEPTNLKTQTDTHLEDEHEPNKQNTRNYSLKYEWCVKVLDHDI